MAYRITYEPKGAYKRFHGFVTFAEFVRSAEEVQGSSGFDDFLYTINDFTDVTDFDVQASHVDHVAALTTGSRLTNDRILIAVITADPRIRALTEQFSKSSPRISETRIFATLAEGRAWIKDRRNT